MNKKLLKYILIGLAIIILVVVLAVGYRIVYLISIRGNCTAPDPIDCNAPMKNGLYVYEPVMNQEVRLPITVTGNIDGGGGWTAFEGVAGSVQVFDANGKAVSERTPLQATTDWMQPKVYFEAMVGDRQTMSNLNTQTGYLLFRNDNPKGDPSEDKEFRLPIKFAK